MTTALNDQFAIFLQRDEAIRNQIALQIANQVSDFRQVIRSALNDGREAEAAQLISGAYGAKLPSSDEMVKAAMDEVFKRTNLNSFIEVFLQCKDSKTIIYRSRNALSKYLIQHNAHQVLALICKNDDELYWRDLFDDCWRYEKFDLIEVLMENIRGIRLILEKFNNYNNGELYCLIAAFASVAGYTRWKKLHPHHIKAIRSTKFQDYAQRLAIRFDDPSATMIWLGYIADAA